MFDIEAIGRVESPLRERSQAPKQGDEGAPDAWLVLDERVAGALLGVQVGDDLLVLTWLDRAARDTLQVYPRGDPERGMHGVFATRSPDRPNPIGLHRVEVLAVDGNRLHVRNLEALDGTRSLTSSRPSRASASPRATIVAAVPEVLRPLFEQVVIKELEPDRMRKSGLLVPAGTNDMPPNEGIVLAVGDGPPDLPDFKMPVGPGDHVVFPRSAGVWVEIEDERLLVCRVRELLGVIETEGSPDGEVVR